MKVFALLMLCVSSVFAAQAVQTDWSGEQGIAGPVTDWGNGFIDQNSISRCSIPGQVQLASAPLDSPVEHLIATGIQNAYSALVCDLNQDGFNDVAVGSGAEDGVTVFYGSPQGEWTLQEVSTATPGAIGLAVGDFNGDNTLDIAACADTEVHVFYNDGGTVPQWEPAVPGSGYQSLHDVEACDMDQDGDWDIVAADYDGDRLFWLRNDGGSWTDLTISTSIDYPCKQHPADINGDGHMDVACSAWMGNSVMVYYGSGGSEPVWTEQEVDSNCIAAHGTRVFDADGDGDMDIAAASINSSSLYLYRSSGGSSPSWTRETMGMIAGTAMVRLGDIDGDGDIDATASSWGNAGVAWWENDGTGDFTKHIVKTGGQATSWSITGDLDNDGDLDIAAVRYQQGSVYWYEVSEFLSSGWIESSILDTEESPQWSSFDWNGSIPQGTGFSFQFRSADDPSSMGDWSEEYASPRELSGEVGRYFQYRLNLESFNPSVSPVIQEVQLNWDPQGTGGADPDATPMVNCGNPSLGAVRIRVSEGTAGPVTVTLFSAEGRRILSRQVFPGEGIQENGLSTGVYLYEAESETGEIQVGKTVLVGN